MYFGLQQNTWDCIDPPSFKQNSPDISTFYKFLSILKHTKLLSKKYIKKSYYLRIFLGVIKFGNLQMLQLKANRQTQQSECLLFNLDTFQRFLRWDKLAFSDPYF